MIRRYREAADFDLTPLIDMMFLLLVFFLASSVFRLQQPSLALTLPQVRGAPSAPPEADPCVIVELSGDALVVDGAPVTFEELGSVVGRRVTGATAVRVLIGETVTYGRTARLLAELQGVPAGGIQLLVRSTAEGPSGAARLPW